MKIKKVRVGLLAGAITAVILSGANLTINRNNISEVKTVTTTTSKDGLDYLIEGASKNSLILSEEALEHINSIYQEQLDNPFIEILDINEQNATTAYVNREDVSEHKNSAYYDSETNTIKWNELADRVYQNSQKRAGVQENQIDYEPLEEKQIKIYLKEYEKLLNNILESYPDYDVEELACKLEDLAIMKANTDSIQGSYITLATTSQDQITFYPESLKEDALSQQSTNIHEGFHLLTGPCNDYDSIPLTKGQTKGAVSVETPFLVFPATMDDYCFERYYFPFISEIYAELYSKEYLNLGQNAYLNYDEVLDLLQLSLCLNQNYQIDSFLQDVVYQDSTSFISHFTVYGEDKTDSFLDNLKMLKSFDLVLTGPSTQFIEDVRKEGYTKEQAYATLTDGALLQTKKIFYSNLIALNEQNTLTLQDNIMLMKLYDDVESSAYIAIQNEVFYKDDYAYFSKEDSLLSQDNKIEEEFISYLEQRYGYTPNQIYAEKEHAEYDTDYQFPSCLSSETTTYLHSMMIEQKNGKASIYPYTKQLVKE